MSCPLLGCSGAPTMIASGQSNPTYVAASSVAICWTNQGTAPTNYADGALMCVLK